MDGYLVGKIQYIDDENMREEEAEIFRRQVQETRYQDTLSHPHPPHTHIHPTPHSAFACVDYVVVVVVPLVFGLVPFPVMMAMVMMLRCTSLMISD